MELVVFGASGPTGRQVVSQALAMDHDVTAVTRRPDEYPIHGPRAAADVTDADRVRDALAGGRAVISTYGVPYSRKPVTVYSEGIANVIAGMRAHGITRLVCVSSTTLATEEAPGESLLARKALLPLLRRVVGRTLYDDMEVMERAIRSSDVEWTIVRPGGLFDTPRPTGDVDVSTQRLPGRLTSRADLARTLILEATSRDHVGTTIEVITRSQLPGLVTFLRDAFQLGR